MKSKIDKPQQFENISSKVNINKKEPQGRNDTI